MKTIFVLIAAVLLSIPSFAGNDKIEKNVKSHISETVENMNMVDISGSVIDNKSNELLAGATIFIDGNKYYSDLDGKFSVSDLKPGKHTVRVELISYQPSEVEIELAKNQKINIVLEQQ